MDQQRYITQVQSGLQYFRSGEFELAEHQFRDALRQKQDDDQLWNLLGASLHRQAQASGNIEGGQAEQLWHWAIEAYSRAISLNRHNPEYHNNLGCALRYQGQFEEAITALRRALALQPVYGDAYYNLGETYSFLGRLEEAERCYSKAISFDPKLGDAYVKLARISEKRGRDEEVEQRFREGIKHAGHLGDLHQNFALFLLARGRFAEAWYEYQWRITRWQFLAAAKVPFYVFPRTPMPMELSGAKLTVYPEQGLGDVLLFLRFVPELVRRGAEVKVCVPSRLLGLLQASNLGAEVLSVESAPKPDKHSILVGDLPFLTGISPPDSLKFSVRKDLQAVLREKLIACGPSPYIGLTWRAGAMTKESKADPYLLRKGVPMEALAGAVARIPGTLIALQRETGAEQIQAFASVANRALPDFGSIHENIEELAAFLSLLDGYVGVSNTNMHLLAGLGKTADVLIPYPAEWRWMASGDVSPWFPGFRMFRQQLEFGSVSQGMSDSWASSLMALSVAEMQR